MGEARSWVEGAVAVLYVCECVCIIVLFYIFSYHTCWGSTCLVLSSPNTYYPSELLYSLHSKAGTIDIDTAYFPPQFPISALS